MPHANEPWIERFEQPARAGSIERSLIESYAALQRRVRSRLQPEHGLGVDPDDIVQDTLLAAWRAAERFELHGSGAVGEAHGDAHGESFARAFRAWLLTIADQKTIDAMRRQRVVSDLDQASSTDVGAVDPLELSEAAARIYGGLEALPADQRSVLMLRDVFGLEWSAVADLLGRKVNACQALRVRGCGALARLDAAGPERSPAAL